MDRFRNPESGIKFPFFLLELVGIGYCSTGESPESGFRFLAGICIYVWISLVSHSFLWLIQGIFNVEIFF